ncbi:forkhead-associated domain-containing protein 1 isoform X2 [Ornithorhynchus anatinus]|uniref:forkhead-associated domain-containing protein 1 isoform X2 n=1 Tax=Ornithorhynchus anatinus TaxID=9258 RepID=UPI0019D413B3|nr:forkhead-associated domain-containing protein 1 isoform X2 [Ornithorhynchus anatinus]
MKAFLKSPESIFVLRNITTIGRHENSDLILRSPGIDDQHALIEFNDSEGSIVLQDFNSLTGTFVNDCHIQNAAVKLEPGDVLRFGARGPTFELVVENSPQFSYPPVIRRAAWAGQLPFVSEALKPSLPSSPSQLPSLQAAPSLGLQRSSSQRSNGVTTPHPPVNKRPASAGVRRMISFVSDTYNRPPAVKQVWANILRNEKSSMNGILGYKSLNQDFSPQEKDEIILKLVKEISRLSGFESESKHKDSTITNLQNEIATLSQKLSQAAPGWNEMEMAQKLLSLDRDIGAKVEEIQSLKEQISHLQRGSSEVLCHTLSERDLEITNLKNESENLRKSNTITSALVTSLQNDIAAKEQQNRHLKQEVDRLESENREKDHQLAAIIARCSSLKAEIKKNNLEAKEKELRACKNHITEMEREMKRLKEEVDKSQREQKMSMKRLEENNKVEKELQEESKRKSLELKEMACRELLIKTNLEEATSQLEHFRSQIIEAIYGREKAVPEKTVPNQQLIEKISQVIEDHVSFQQKKQALQEEILSRNLKEEEISEHIKELRKSLEACQACLKLPYYSLDLRRELSILQDLRLDPSILWIQEAVVEVLTSLLSLVEEIEQLLQETGIELSSSDKGISLYMKNLLESHQKIVSKAQTLQAELDHLQETQHSLLQEKLNEQSIESEKQLQAQMKQMWAEKEEENKMILENRIAQEKSKAKEAVEEEKKKVQDLENHLGKLEKEMECKAQAEQLLNSKLNEVLAKLEAIRKSEDREKYEMILQTKLNATLAGLEEARNCQAALEEQVLVQQQQLRLVQEQNDLQRHQLQEEIVQYKEQIRQHSQTIVTLEEELQKATQQRKEEEIVALKENIPVAQVKVQKDLPKLFPPQDVSANEKACYHLIEDIVTARREILSQQDLILRLREDLAEAQARMSDLRGELNEKQKIELERNISLVQQQRQELRTLRGRLSEMANLAEKKDKEQKILTEELRCAQEKLKTQDAEQEKSRKTEQALCDVSVQTNVALENVFTALKQKPSAGLSDLGAKCMGFRHEEVIQRQKKALSELRLRVKELEKVNSPNVHEKGTETILILKKEMLENTSQKTFLENESGLPPVSNTEARMPQISLPNCYMAIERTAKLETMDALDLSERLYLDLMHTLGSLMNIKELSGPVSLKNLSQNQREQVSHLRQRDLELVCGNVSQLQRRLERKEELLREYETDNQQLRLSKVSLQMYQSQMNKLEDNVYKEAEENALLREALERTQDQLNQERRMSRAVKQQKRVEFNQRRLKCTFG